MHQAGVPAAQVLVGFETSLNAALALARRATRVSVLLPAILAEEFATSMAADYGGIVERGGSVRILAAGALDPEVHMLLNERGVKVRELREAREVGLLVSEHEVLLFPFGQDAENPLEVCAVLVRDLIATAHFQLAFEQAWDRGKAA